MHFDHSAGASAVSVSCERCGASLRMIGAVWAGSRDTASVAWGRGWVCRRCLTEDERAQLPATCGRRGCQLPHREGGDDGRV